MQKHFFLLSLRTQLLIMMLSMMMLSLGGLTFLQESAEERIMELIQDGIDGLSKAIEISVEQITASGATNEARLKNYFDQIRSRGVEEISILSSKQEVLISSNPDIIGSKLSVDKNELFITQQIGEDKEGKTKKLYSSFVPVIFHGKLEGYIHIRMYFDDLEKISQEMLSQRILWALVIFGVGTLLCIFISYRYTRTIPVLINAIRTISHGQMPDLPTIPRTDMSDLADSLSEMIRKLEEQKSMEEKLKHAQQQAMLAQLAAGIAHEIRNPMNFVSLTIDHLEATLALKNGTNIPEDLFRKTKLEIRRINQMIINFLDLGRELVLNRIRLKADLALEEALGLTASLLRDLGIHVVKKYSQPMPEIDVDIDRMKSCFQNLIHNATDAMSKGGSLCVTIEAADGWIIYTVEDTGEGIGENDIARIYEPYFTTKKHGIGLGLAITRRIVEAHGGTIMLTSEPGKGTTARVMIPIA